MENINRDEAFLKELIEKIIRRYSEKINPCKKREAELKEYLNFINELINNNINNLAEVDIEYFRKLAQMINLDENEILFKQIMALHKASIDNKTKGTTIEIESKKGPLKSLNNMLNHNLNQLIPQMTVLNEVVNHFNGMLEKINANEPLTNTEMDDICKYISASMEDTIKIFEVIYRYNVNCYAKKKNANYFQKPIQTLLDVDEVRLVFKKYYYDYDNLEDTDKNNLLKYGNIDNMEIVFSTLKSLRFPKLKLPDYSKQLISLLICGKKEVIEKIVNYSRANNITNSSLMKILSALLPQTIKGSNESNTPGGEKEKVTIPGRSEFYIKNVDYLKKLGILSMIVKQCPSILIINPDRLKDNYDGYLRYCHPDGIVISHPASFNFLSSKVFYEIIDQFIECDTNGFYYIINNLSKIHEHSNPFDIMFYNIYASNMPRTVDGKLWERSKPTPEGPYNKTRTDLALRGEITRERPEWRNKPYRGITDETKQEITGTIDMVTKNYSEFSSAIKKWNEDDDSYHSFNTNLSKLADELEQEFPWLLNYKKFFFAYDFNGKYISRYKVARIYNILKGSNLHEKDDALLYAITYNSIMNAEEFEEIKRIVKENEKGRGGK